MCAKSTASHYQKPQSGPLPAVSNKEEGHTQCGYSSRCSTQEVSYWQWPKTKHCQKGVKAYVWKGVANNEPQSSQSASSWQMSQISASWPLKTTRISYKYVVYTLRIQSVSHPHDVSAQCSYLMACFKRRTIKTSGSSCSCLPLGMPTPSYTYIPTQHWRWWRQLALPSTRHWGSSLL